MHRRRLTPFVLLFWGMANSALGETADELVAIARAKAALLGETMERSARGDHNVDDLATRAEKIARADGLPDRLRVEAHERRESGKAMPLSNPFADPQPVAVRGLPSGDGDTPVSTEEPFVSRGGRFLFFNSGEREGNKDLHYAEWQNDGWVYRGEIGPDINDSVDVQGNPTMDRHGNFLFIDSGEENMMLAGRFRPESGRVEEVHSVRGIPPRETQFFKQKVHGNMGVELVANGEIAFFSRATWDLNGVELGQIIGSDLAFAKKDGEAFVFDERETRRVLAQINTSDLEYAASISADGLELFFTRLPAASLASGNIRSHIMRAARASTTAAFGEPKVVEAIGTAKFVEGPAIAPDGRTLYYHQREGDKFRLYRVTRAR